MYVGIISHSSLCRVVASGYPECGVTISQVIIKTLRKRDVITDYEQLTHFIAHYEKCPETSHDDDLCVQRFFVIMNMSEPPASTQSVDNKAF